MRWAPANEFTHRPGLLGPRGDRRVLWRLVLPIKRFASAFRGEMDVDHYDLFSREDERDGKGQASERPCSRLQFNFEPTLCGVLYGRIDERRD